VEILFSSKTALCTFVCFILLQEIMQEILRHNPSAGIYDLMHPEALHPKRLNGSEVLEPAAPAR
jgi:hypothetical protein